MFVLSRAAAVAAAILVVGGNPAHADYELTPSAMLQTQSASETATASEPAAPLPARLRRAREPAAETGPAGTLIRQTPRVAMECFRPALVEVIRRASRHFGSAAVITSGYRPGRHSFHGKCMAADVQIAGVAPSRLAAWFRAQEDVGGVGTYRHTRSVHVDVAERSFSWHGGGRRRVASL